MLEYILYLCAHFLAVSFPTPLKYWIGLRVSDMYFLFHNKNRKAVLSNFDKIPLGKNKHEAARTMFHNFSKSLADFLFISQLDKNNWRNWVKTIDEKKFDEAYRQKKGVIALTAHIGNWELGGIILSLMGYPISAIVLPQKNRAVNDIFFKQRLEKGLKPIFLGQSLIEGVRKLRKGEVLAIVGDRNIGFSKSIRDKTPNKTMGVEVNFFGRKVYFPKGPAILAYWTQALILPGFTVRDNDDKYTLYFENPIQIERCKNKEEFIKINTQKIASVIEKYVRHYPEQWCVFEEVWQE
ncbi:MAG: lysophospholipid acyltransferase family protein [Candidatus Ratteibacteria bacterium]|nr:lysophospholipid acyltransferase family protein [Candidatus Ratteibacteria bacterium]